ncbi:unnamed protein product, partial [Brenthis ino]
MLRGFAFTLLVTLGVSCMKMRETVERTVMVRTTGSDLQPAATGFIYKKQNDGEESVIEMGESEVMEQLSKLYTEPQSYVAPIPIKKAFENKNGENKEKSKDDERIIPVKEKAEDDHVGHVDGIADDDYKKIFDEYSAHYGDNTSYEDYLRSLGHFEDGYKGGSKQDDEGYKDKNYYKNGGTGDYHNEKYESYSFSGNGSHEDSDGDADRHHYDNRKIHKGHNDANSKEKSDGYRKVFNKDQKYKDYGPYGNDGKTFQNYGSVHHGLGYGKDDSHESGHHAGILVKQDEDDKASGEHEHNQSAEDESSQEKHGDFGSESRQITDHGYGFKIKH